MNFGWFWAASRKLTSLRVVELVIFPLVFRSTRLPLRSNMYCRPSGFFNYRVFSIKIRCTSLVASVLTVKTPNILVKRLHLLFFWCKANWGKQSSRSLSSFAVKVLIMNLLSWLKKKKLPLRPAPSPALNTCSRFNIGFKLASNAYVSLKYSWKVSIKSHFWWNMTLIFLWSVISFIFST